jgi:RHS repeat-associated protein
MNERVQVTAQGFTTQYAFGLNGQRVSSWDGIACAPTLLSANTYWNGTPVSVFDGYQNSYQHQDLLGTKRLLTGSDGSVIGASTSLPFGDGLSLAGADSDPYHFAGLDHDAESGTEHASFRQYSSTFGRWMSPDPYSGSYDFTNPQSLNRYTYVLNNPLTLVDPAGLDPYCANGNPTDDTQALCNGNNNAIWMDDSTTCLIGTPGVQCTNPAAYAPIEQTVTVTAEPSSSLSGGLMGLTGQIPGIDSIGGGGVAPSNAPSQPCFVQRAQNILPNSQYLGPGDFVDGHQQYYFSAPASDFGTNGLNSFSFLGIVPNGYRTGSVFQSIHANGPHGIPNPTYFEIHEDLMNPASGLFGAVGHGLLDYGLGKLNQLGIHINLDGKC